MDSITGVSYYHNNCCVIKQFGANVMNWFASYLRDCVQHVRFDATSSLPSAVYYGVPQGSVLGLILFLLHTTDLLQLIKRHPLKPHAYAYALLILWVLPSSRGKQTGRQSVCLHRRDIRMDEIQPTAAQSHQGQGHLVFIKLPPTPDPDWSDTSQ